MTREHASGSCLGQYHTDRQPGARQYTTRCPEGPSVPAATAGGQSRRLTFSATPGHAERHRRGRAHGCQYPHARTRLPVPASRKPASRCPRPPPDRASNGHRRPRTAIPVARCCQAAAVPGRQGTRRGTLHAQRSGCSEHGGEHRRSSGLPWPPGCVPWPAWPAGPPVAPIPAPHAPAQPRPAQE